MLNIIFASIMNPRGDELFDFIPSVDLMIENVGCAPRRNEVVDLIIYTSKML